MSIAPVALSAQQMGADVVSIMLAGMTIAFLLMYVKRLIVVSFLAIISPLVTITYSLDKIKRPLALSSSFF